VRLKPPLSLSAILKGLMSGDLSAKEVRRPSEEFQLSSYKANLEAPSLTILCCLLRVQQVHEVLDNCGLD